MNPFSKRMPGGQPSHIGSQFNARLERLHADMADIDKLHQRLRGIGFSNDELPATADRQAYCLLGDHQRPETLAMVQASEGELLEKAVIAQPLTNLSTPVLRLLAAIAPDLNRVQALWDRIDHAMATALTTDTSDFALHLPPPPLRALEGKRVRITGHAIGCEWLLVAPDPVFNMRETLLESRGAHEFEIEIPCASGLLTIAGLNEHGQVLRKQIRLQAIPPWSDMPGVTNITDMTGAGHAAV